ncbi:MAG: DEAD/DEAH box helicase [Acidimicrobiales bacterium]
MNVEGTLDRLRSGPDYRGQIVHIETLSGRPATFRDPTAPLGEPLQRYLDAKRLSLYLHQADAIDAWRGGDDILLSTRTASGKSLAFALCVSESLLESRDATALLLYPTKALAHDQVNSLRAFDSAVGLGARPAAYDGDTPQGARGRIRRDSRIIVSNFYDLHEYLPQAQGLQRFLSNLEVIVIDEAHRYRGILGGHAERVLRRLLRLAASLGARPRFILASATIANPGEHAKALSGRDVNVIDSDGSAQGERTVAIWDSMADPNRSAARQAAAIAANLARQHVPTLVFTGSRVGTELVARWTAQMAPDRKVSPYRGGYSPAERRSIEADLRDGKLDVVVSTNALELGIDIGSLDAVVLTGYPGTIASTWQQIGRAGRAQEPSLGVLVAGDDPLDQYLVRRPHILFSSPIEAAAIAINNPEIMVGHVLCAAAELPVDASAEEPTLGPHLAEVVVELEGDGLLASSGAGYSYSGTFRPASRVRIDGRTRETVEIRANDELIEEMEQPRALKQAHEGAIFLHRGQSYRVLLLDLERHLAIAEAVEVREHTEALVSRDYELGDGELSGSAGKWSMWAGDVVIREWITGYRLFTGDEMVGQRELELPPIELYTRAVWLRPTVSLGELLERDHDPLGSLHAAEHALIHAMPLLSMCDRGDAGGISVLADRYARIPLIVLYDGYTGGTGITELAFERIDELATIAWDMVSGCDCESGCPRCVYDRSCGSGNEPMNRLGAVRILASLQVRPAGSVL